MGWVDKLDQMVSHYRIFIKSKKWTLRMIFHAVDLACTNSWLEYKQEAISMEFPKNKIMDSLHFKMRLAETLIRVGKPVTLKRKVGRPSGENIPPCTSTPSSSKKTKRNEFEVKPFKEIQTDLVDHFPEYDNKKEATRCKNIMCQGKTHVYCIKCNVHLCFVKNRNCFKTFHTEY